MMRKLNVISRVVGFRARTTGLRTLAAPLHSASLRGVWRSARDGFLQDSEKIRTQLRMEGQDSTAQRQHRMFEDA